MLYWPIEDKMGTGKIYKFRSTLFYWSVHYSTTSKVCIFTSPIFGGGTMQTFDLVLYTDRATKVLSHR